MAAVCLWRAGSDQTLLFQGLTKDLEVKAELKTAVAAGGAQMLQLREAGGDLGQNPGDDEALLPRTSDLDLCSIQSQLRQTELDWAGLLADVPAVQQALHQVRMVT